MALDSHIRKRSKFSGISFFLRKVKNEQQLKHKISRKKEIRIRENITAIKNMKSTEKIK